MYEINTVRDLRDAYQARHPEGRFFDPETLSLYGESFPFMYMLKRKEEVTDHSGERHTCYVLNSRQTTCFAGKNYLGSKKVRHYFDENTFDYIRPVTV